MIDERKTNQTIIYKAANREAEATITRITQKLIKEFNFALDCKEDKAALQVIEAREVENAKWTQRYDLQTDTLNSIWANKLQDLMEQHEKQLLEVHVEAARLEKRL